MGLRIFDNLEQLFTEMSDTSNLGTLGIVPTTGFFHYGVLELIQRSRSENDTTLVIVMDPTDLGQDFKFNYEELNYSDREHLIRQGVDAFVLLPKAITPRFVLQEKFFGDFLGLKREVIQSFATRFLKLLVRIRPQNLYWSDLHYRQALILDNLIQDFAPTVNLVRHSIVRESNGLPHSSVNALLSSSEKDFAIRFHKILLEQFQECIGLSSKMVVDRIVDSLEDEGFADVSIQIFDERMDHSETIGKLSRLFASVKIRDVNLVDNLPVKIAS